MSDELTEGWEVPAFRAEVLTEKRSRYAAAVFVINEGERVRTQLGKMAALSGEIDLVVADGGSTDGSLDAPFPESCGVRAVLTKTGPGKLSAQMRMAMAWAMREGYEGLVVIDGNNKDDHSAIPAFMRALDEGYDHVQGSRYVPGGRAINTPFSPSLTRLRIPDTSVVTIGRPAAMASSSTRGMPSPGCVGNTKTSYCW